MGQLRCDALSLGRRLALLMVGALAAGCAEAPGVSIELGSKFGEFALVNHGETVSVQSAVAVEQLVNGKWTPQPVTNFYVKEFCGTDRRTACRDLGKGRRIEVVPWKGNYCLAQCPAPCRLDGPAPAGTYRFVITTCDGKHKFMSPAFEKR